MNKYLLISALFGFVFNGFVFGADKLPDSLPLSKCLIEINGRKYYPTGNLVGGKEALGDTLNSLNVVRLGSNKGMIVGALLKNYEFKEVVKGKKGKSVLENICSYNTDIRVEVSGDNYIFKLQPELFTWFDVYDGLEYVVSDGSDLKFLEEVVSSEKWYSAGRSYDGVNTDSVFGLIKFYNDNGYFECGRDNCCVKSNDFYVTISFSDIFCDSEFDLSLDSIMNNEESYKNVIPNVIWINYHKIKSAEEPKVDNTSESGGKGGVPASTGGDVDMTKIGGGSDMTPKVDDMTGSKVGGSKTGGASGMAPEGDDMFPKVDGDITGPKVGGGVDSSKTGGSKDGKEGGIGSVEKGDKFSDGEKKLPGKGLGLGNMRIPSGGSSGSGSSSGSNSKSKKKRCGCKCSGK